MMSDDGELGGMTDSAPRRSRRRLYIILAAVAAVPLIVLAVFRFGNPQWHRYFYMFQSYVWVVGDFENAEDGDPTMTFMKPPPGYTGTWRQWSSEGRLLTEVAYVDGKQNGRASVFLERGYVNVYHMKDGNFSGPYQEFYPDGSKLLVGALDGRKRVGEWNSWHPNGKPWISCVYVDGLYHGEWTRRDKSGELAETRYYRRGKRVTEEEYNAGE